MTSISKKNRIINARKQKCRLYDIQRVCHYCDREFPKDLLTVDHYIPRSKGGSNDISNLVLACSHCNGLKTDIMPQDFWQAVKMLRSIGIDVLADQKDQGFKKQLLHKTVSNNPKLFRVINSPVEKHELQNV